MTKSIQALVAKMDKKEKTVSIEDGFATLKYNGVPLVFSFSEDKMIYVSKENGDDLFVREDGLNPINLNLLRKYGVPMGQFFKDFYNQGYSLEDSFNNHYLYLATCPIRNLEALNAMFNENEDSYEFFYTETNLVFLVDKAMPTKEIRVYDYDDPEKNLFDICLSDEELENNGVNLSVFKEEFKGFTLCSANGKLSRLIGED